MGVTRGELARHIMLRNDPMVGQQVNAKIREMGWAKTAKLLSSLRESGNVPGNPYFPVRKGTFRDSMIRLLGLECVSGLDCDLLDVFREVDVYDLMELRREILDLSLDRLRNQIKRRNTFFLDSQNMATTPYAVLVADLLEARSAEISELPSKPSLREVFSTYYGFVVITTGSIEKGFAGASKEAINGIENLSCQFGDQVTIPAKIIKRSDSAFSNCTEYTKKLLWGLLRVAASGYDKRSNAVRELGELGDERALPVLHSGLESNRGWVMPSLIDAIGKIGDPSSLELLQRLLNGRDTRKNAIVALGGIRHESALSCIKRVMDSDRAAETPGIKALGETRQPEAIPILTKILKSRRGGKRVHAMNSLLMIGKEGICVLMRNREIISKAIRSSGAPGKAIEIAQALPDFNWENSEIEAIAKVITKHSHMKGLAEALREIPEVLSDIRVIDAIIEVYKDAYSQDATQIRGSYYSYRARWKARRALRKIQGFEQARVLDTIAQSILSTERSTRAARRIAESRYLMQYSNLRQVVAKVLKIPDPRIQTPYETWYRP